MKTIVSFVLILFSFNANAQFIHDGMLDWGNIINEVLVNNNFENHKTITFTELDFFQKKDRLKGYKEVMIFRFKNDSIIIQKNWGGHINESGKYTHKKTELYFKYKPEKYILKDGVVIEKGLNRDFKKSIVIQKDSSGFSIIKIINRINYPDGHADSVLFVKNKNGKIIKRIYYHPEGTSNYTNYTNTYLYYGDSLVYKISTSINPKTKNSYSFYNAWRIKTVNYADSLTVLTKEFYCCNYQMLFNKYYSMQSVATISLFYNSKKELIRVENKEFKVAEVNPTITNLYIDYK